MADDRADTPTAAPALRRGETVRSITMSRWYPLVLFLGVALVLFVLVAVSRESFGRFYAFGDEQRPSTGPEAYYTGPAWLAGWVRWDSGWYRSIADDGYFFRGKLEQSSVALLAFPLLGSKDFFGLGRYALGAFPAFAIAGELLAERPRARRCWFAFSAVALCVFAASFARGGFIA